MEQWNTRSIHSLLLVLSFKAKGVWFAKFFSGYFICWLFFIKLEINTH